MVSTFWTRGDAGDGDVLGKSLIKQQQNKWSEGSPVAAGVMFMVASWPWPGVRQATHGPSPGPVVAALLHAQPGLSERVSRGLGIPQSMDV